MTLSSVDCPANAASVAPPSATSGHLILRLRYPAVQKRRQDFIDIPADVRDHFDTPGVNGTLQGLRDRSAKQHIDVRRFQPMDPVKEIAIAQIALEALLLASIFKFHNQQTSGRIENR